MKLLPTFTVFAVTYLAFSTVAAAQDLLPPKDIVPGPKAEYSPYAGDHFPNQVLFGDTHLHSSWSADSGMAGGVLDQDAGYRVSRGEEVTSALGWRVKLVRPLDFIVMADHAENLGLAPMIEESNPALLAIPWGREIHDRVKAGDYHM